MGLRIASKQEFLKALQEFSVETGRSLESVAISSAAYACLDSMRFTPPLAPGGGGGEGKAAEMVGNRAIDRDVKSLFVAANDKGRAPAAIILMRMQGAARMRNMGDFIKAQSEAKQVGLTLDTIVGNKIIQDGDAVRAYKKAANYFNQASVKMTEYGTPLITNDLRAVHDAAKRQSGGKTKISAGMGDYRGKYLVESTSVLMNYIKERQRQVGFLKAGWWNVLTSLPLPKNKKGNPKLASKTVSGYVKRFPGAPVSVTKSTDVSMTNLTIANMNGDNDGMATKFDVPNIVYGQAIRRIEGALENEMIANARKFNR